MKKILFTILIVGAVAVGIYLYQSGGAPKSMMEEEADVMPAEEPAKVVEETDVEVATLEAVGGYSGNGTASRRYDGTTFVHTVIADIGDPGAGKFYEGWLVRPEPLDVVSTGKLEKVGNTYIVQFISDIDLSDHAQIVITEETEANGLDGVPETHVLEGSF